jgi:hypothetical protein
MIPSKVKRLILAATVAALLALPIVAVAASQPPGQLGYEGQPGYQGNGQQGYEGQPGNQGGN